VIFIGLSPDYKEKSPYKLALLQNPMAAKWNQD
jgi:hypothetical protein